MEAKYFENYKIKKKDIKVLTEGLDLLYESGLVDKKAVDHIRFVTFDSEYLYVFTRGEHSSTRQYKVKELPSQSRTGFRIFQIKHSGLIGRKIKDYKSAYANFISEETESTTKNSDKFYNEFIIGRPYYSQKTLDAIYIPPYKPFIKIHKTIFSYLTDIIFHEAGHIEYKRIRNWQLSEKYPEDFYSQEKKRKFLETIRKTKLFPRWFVNYLIRKIFKASINEMYAILIDREAARRYDPKRLQKEEKDFSRFLEDLKIKKKKIIYPQINYYEYYQTYICNLNHHAIGRLLVRILEEQFLNFEERKKFVQWVLGRYD